MNQRPHNPHPKGLIVKAVPPPGSVGDQNNWILMKLHEYRGTLTPWESEFSQSIATQLKERGTLSKKQRDKALQILGKRMKE